jgi:predicted ATPase/class 3 adenylate cyclase
MAELPSGTVTFLLTDVEGSTALWEQAPEAMRAALARHDALFEESICQHRGVHIRPRGEGDSRFAVFSSAPDAVAAAVAIQRALTTEPWPTPRPIKVRIGVHSGEAELRDGDYYGSAVNRCGRLRGIGHGGQVLLSEATTGLVRDDLPAGASLLDLGEHRLRDLSRPERVFQLIIAGLPVEFPTLRTLDARPNNLPTQLTSFIGREREMADVKRLLAATRLLTLTGAGGAGKTRLALQVAADVLEAYPDGVWLVELAPISDPSLVPQTIASVFGLHDERGRPLPATLADYLRPKRLLLVLDNCEHLIEACAALVDGLLRACPPLRILATSREALGIAGETAWRMPSLSLPDRNQLPSTESLTQYEAVRLFIERAVAAQRSFGVTNQNAPAVAQVCHQLDGIPLAIELAAARVKVLAVEQIAARLDDCFRLLTGGSRTALPRQQTLRAAIDWSFSLLSEAERILLRRLSVFAGGWTLEAAEAVCGDREPDISSQGSADAGGTPTADSRLLTPEDVFDVLSHLVDKSLVLAEEQGGEERYRLLETVRQYAQDRLREAGEAASVRNWHRDWFLELVERAEPQLQGPEQAVWFERLETEHDNLRAALAWSETNPGGLEDVLRLAGPMWWFWILRGHVREGRERLARILAQAPAPTSQRAKVLQGAGYLAFAQGDYDHAQALMEESLVLSRQLGDKRGIAIALAQLGRMAHGQGEYATATTLLEDSQALFEELGSELGLPYPVACILGDVARDQGDDRRARELYEGALTRARGRGDKHAIAYVLRGLAYLLRACNDSGQAEALFKESLTQVWELKDQRCACLSIGGLARATVGQGRDARAARLFGMAEGIGQLVGTRVPPAEREAYEQDLATVRGVLSEESFAAAWAEGRAMSIEQAIAYALEGSAPT